MQQRGAFCQLGSLCFSHQCQAEVVVLTQPSTTRAATSVIFGVVWAHPLPAKQSLNPISHKQDIKIPTFPIPRQFLRLQTMFTIRIISRVNISHVKEAMTGLSPKTLMNVSVVMLCSCLLSSRTKLDCSLSLSKSHSDSNCRGPKHTPTH